MMDADAKRAKRAAYMREYMRRGDVAAKAAQQRELKAKHRAENLDSYKDRAKAYYEANKEAIKAKQRARYAIIKHDHDEQKRREDHRKENAAAYKIYARRYRQNYPEKAVARTQRRNASMLRATPSWANEFFIEEAYRLAKQREKVCGGRWHVDHIVPLRSRLVCGLHVEHNLQVIPARQNLSKNNRWWPDMPGAA